MGSVAVRLGILTGLLLPWAVGCGHTPVPVAVRAVDSYAYRQTLSGVRVAVDPFFTADQIRTVFAGGEDFLEKGLLPMQLVIENGGRDALRIRPEAARLLRPDGRPYFSLPPYEAFSMIKLGVGWWAVGAGLVGGAAPAYRTEVRQKDIEVRALREGTVAAGGSLNGFLYFAIVEGAQNLTGHRLLLPVGTADGREWTFEIPVAGSRDIPASATPASAPGPAPVRSDQPSGGGVIIRSPK